ncbi:SGNH/GDSL hydrolase family protein [Curtobacterium sp. MCPF17_002]|uniref:SGNH/GDSL hydrolase family protein n=1 Tax=Curtobacterium sp. MCPF17_002 TaxID=2175645 RepID=UPI0015E882F3|nr:SGNH/GDSL hydrolase family protein [Curtobacterium sp. MCPF17_002]WIB78908.1 SGNH/GDSL hydrolase family protein [Curtobacterium sp. MCPF17_002]
MRRPRFLVVSLAVVVTAFAVPVFAVEPTAPQAAGIEPEHDLRVAVVGDSLSAGRSGFLGNGLDDESWMTYAKGDGIDFAGGWARAGATPDEMAAAVTPIRDVDVLVILAGTNAVRTGETFEEERAAYEKIVTTVGAREVIVSDLPPYRWKPFAAQEYGRALQRFVNDQGWRWADPWVFARSGSSWAPGVTTDGTHPADAAEYRRLGEAFHNIILAVGSATTA